MAKRSEEWTFQLERKNLNEIEIAVEAVRSSATPNIEVGKEGTTTPGANSGRPPPPGIVKTTVSKRAVATFGWDHFSG